MKKSTSGFTIVELLIVIVVIGILAAIVIVAYNGVQNRAYDTSVQVDLENAGKGLGVYKSFNGSFPNGSTTDAIEAMLNDADLKFSRGAYATDAATTNSNIFYAFGGNGDDFVMVAKSKSGNVFYFSSKTGSVDNYQNLNPQHSFPQSGGSYIKQLTGMDGATHVWGFGNGNWRPWVKQ